MRQSFFCNKVAASAVLLYLMSYEPSLLVKCNDNRIKEEEKSKRIVISTLEDFRNCQAVLEIL